MTPTSLDAIRALIELANNLISQLNILLTTDRPQFAQRIVYIGAKFYLQFLVEQLEQIAWELALQEIQEFIGNEVFTGEDANSEPYALETMTDIRNELRNNCTPEDLECIVGKTATFPQINAAVKQRIIDDVIEIVGFAYTGRDSGGTALPVLENNQLVPWDDENVSALSLYAGVPFFYNRALTAGKAITLASQGDRNSTSDGEVDGIQFPLPPGATDSARFISVALRAGGLLLVTTGQVGECEFDAAVGWCFYETSTPDLFQDNTVWANHNQQIANANDDFVDLSQDTRLAGFLLGNPDVLGNGITRYYRVGDEYVPNTDNFEVVSIDEVIGLSPNENPYPPDHLFDSSALEQGIYADIGTNLNTVVPRLNIFGVGDYVVILGPSPHGFVVTGWDDAVKCDGSGNSISAVSIPYVADLPGVQDGDPRPFYCTRIPEDFNDPTSYFAFRLWYFIKVRSVVDCI